MYIKDGIAYAENAAPVLKVNGIRPMEDHKLWVRFNNGETRIFDIKPFLTQPAFRPLTDPGVFRQVYIDFGIPVWNDGDIDIAPEMLYENSMPA